MEQDGREKAISMYKRLVQHLLELKDELSDINARLQVIEEHLLGDEDG